MSNLETATEMSAAEMSDLATEIHMEFDKILDAHAEAIRRIGKRVAHNIIEIGARLENAKELVAHGKWLPWLKREFDWSEQSANRFMQVCRAG